MNDKKIIHALGGVSAVARRLGVSPQRVFNWTHRGIPPKVKLENQELFLKTIERNADEQEQ